MLRVYVLPVNWAILLSKEVFEIVLVGLWVCACADLCPQSVSSRAEGYTTSSETELEVLWTTRERFRLLFLCLLFACG